MTRQLDKKWRIIMGGGWLCLLLMGAGGCGGSLSYNLPGYAQLTIILRVQDVEGNPIGNARVYVDGERDEWTTASEFWPLSGTEYPLAWQGFLHNWLSEAYSLPQTQQPVRFDIAVRKMGWSTDLSLVQMPDVTAEHYFIRDVMTLYPEGAAPQPPVIHQAEVLAAPKAKAAVAFSASTP